MRNGCGVVGVIVLYLLVVMTMEGSAETTADVNEGLAARTAVVN